MATQEFMDDKLIILTKPLLDTLIDQKKDSGLLICLYTFYYYTAKWQNTNQPKATNEFAAKALNISVRRIPTLKRKLISLGLIEQLRKRDKSNKKITGWYIKVKYIFGQKFINDYMTLNNPKTTPSISTEKDSDGVEKYPTNALSSNSKMLKGSEETKVSSLLIKCSLSKTKKKREKNKNKKENPATPSELPTEYIKFAGEFFSNQITHRPELMQSYTEEDIIQSARGIQKLMEVYPSFKFNEHIVPAIKWAVLNTSKNAEFWGDELLTLENIHKKSKNNSQPLFINLYKKYLQYEKGWKEESNHWK